MLAVSACALAAIPGAPAQAAFARASLGVNVQVLEDCSALLSSSTTIIQASFACQGSAVEATLSPTVTSTSLAILAPGVLLGQQSFHTAPGATATALKSESTGAIAPESAGVISVGPVLNEFTVSAADGGDPVVVVTY